MRQVGEEFGIGMEAVHSQGLWDVPALSDTFYGTLCDCNLGKVKIFRIHSLYILIDQLA